MLSRAKNKMLTGCVEKVRNIGFKLWKMTMMMWMIGIISVAAAAAAAAGKDKQSWSQLTCTTSVMTSMQTEIVWQTVTLSATDATYIVSESSNSLSYSCRSAELFDALVFL